MVLVRAICIYYYSTIVFLPYKVKRRRKIRGRNTLLCPSLTGLQQGEYFSNGFRVVYVIRTDKIRMFWILLPENRSQNNTFFCSRIINLSFNGLTYITPANILFIVNLIFTDGIKVFLNTLTKKIEANCKITILFGVE